MEFLKSMAGVDLLHVPYKGAGQFVPALLAGEVHSVIGALNSLLPHLHSGKLRVLAMAGGHRTPLLPGVPTMSESGLPGFRLDNWGGILAPAGTPQQVVERLHKEIVKALADRDVVDRLLTPQGIEVVASTPERFQQVLESDLAKWLKVVKEANIRIE
jgi:tripartite-type tricarboxylate transporter receptor subunit TctC